MPKEHIRREKPVYSIPDRHAEGGEGTRPDGTKVHGTDYVQPWVDSDSIVPDPAHIGKKDVG
jgi:hypothetical protein